MDAFDNSYFCPLPQETLAVILDYLSPSEIYVFLDMTYNMLVEPDYVRYLCESHKLPYVKTLNELSQASVLSHTGLFNLALNTGDRRTALMYIPKNTKDTLNDVLTSNLGYWDMYEVLIYYLSDKEVYDRDLLSMIVYRHTSLASHFVTNKLVIITDYILSCVRMAIVRGFTDLLKEIVEVYNVPIVESNFRDAIDGRQSEVFTYLVTKAHYRHTYNLAEAVIATGDKDLIFAVYSIPSVRPGAMDMTLAVRYGNVDLVRMLHFKYGISVESEFDAALISDCVWKMLVIMQASHYIVTQRHLTLALDNGARGVVRYLTGY